MSTKTSAIIHQDAIHAVNKILVEPIIKPLSENFLKIRRNLLMICLLGLLYVFDVFDICNLSMSGIKIKNGSIKTIEIIGFVIILYQFMHFILEAWEHLTYLRIRVTGTKLSHVTAGKFAAEGGDYPNDPDQSTLYSWWFEQKNLMRQYEQKKNDLMLIVEGIESAPGDLSVDAVKDVQNKLTQFIGLQEAFNNKILSPRVFASLERFDKKFWFYQKLQLIKWFGLELVPPFTIGILTLFGMLLHIMNCV